MKALSPSRVAWRRHLDSNLPLKISTTTTTTTRHATFTSIRKELLSRPPKVHQDQFTTRAAGLLFFSLPPLPLSRARTGFYCLNWPDFEHAVVPQGHHLAFFNAITPVESLLADGTDTNHSPGPPFTRRLWAGGSVAFSPRWQSRVRVGTALWACQEFITDVRIKRGPLADQTSSESAHGPGDKVFVDVHRQYTHTLRPNDTVILERRTLCFMPPKAPDDIKTALQHPVKSTIRAPKVSLLTGEPVSSQSFTLTRAMLARFSGITFNAHRIHLDTQYCREVEGYRDLLVHGPLLLILMMCVFNSRGHIVASIDYQNLAPVYVDEEIKVCIQNRKGSWRVWIEGPKNDLRVKGSAILEQDAEDGKLKIFREKAEESVKQVSTPATLKEKLDSLWRFFM